MSAELSVLTGLGAFFGALALALALTPLVRELHRRLGMVDRPDPRRINKVPIPRGGGLALVLAVLAVSGALMLLRDGAALAGISNARFGKFLALGAAIAAVGLADDRWSLKPLTKLGGQVAVAFLAWAWADLGFRALFPALPAALDAVLTVFWIIGAVNAFNLIDGLDGLAGGLAFIATLGMGGALVVAGQPSAILFHCVFAGALLGFLRYNYNPASVFLGDCGSMFIGFTLATLPLSTLQPDSFLVSVGVPLLAMGVPIFDTSLAILRRTIRRILGLFEPPASDGAGRVMTADADHLHHRILRAVGLSQRKAAWTLYGLASFLVLIGLVGASMRSQRAGLWLAALTVIMVVVVRDASRVELFDAGRLLGRVAHDRSTALRRRIARFAVPLYVVFDLLALALAFYATVAIAGLPLSRDTHTLALPIHMFATFFFLVFFRAYVTVWSRGVLSNYVRLFFACVFGAVLGTVGVYYAPVGYAEPMKIVLVLYTLLPFTGILCVRFIRSIVRDLFYAMDCNRLVARKDVSRILVYGAGLRYRAFRRELVRRTAANDRIIVGLLDDDLLMRGHYIGGLKILGTLLEAPEIINRVNADQVVIACEVTPEWMKVILQTLKPTGVRITHFTFAEEEL